MLHISKRYGGVVEYHIATPTRGHGLACSRKRGVSFLDARWSAGALHKQEPVAPHSVTTRPNTLHIYLHRAHTLPILRTMRILASGAPG